MPPVGDKSDAVCVSSVYTATGETSSCLSVFHSTYTPLIFPFSSVAFIRWNMMNVEFFFSFSIPAPETFSFFHHLVWRFFAKTGFDKTAICRRLQIFLQFTTGFRRNLLRNARNGNIYKHPERTNSPRSFFLFWFKRSQKNVFFFCYIFPYITTSPSSPCFLFLLRRGRNSIFQ